MTRGIAMRELTRIPEITWPQRTAWTQFHTHGLNRPPSTLWGVADDYPYCCRSTARRTDCRDLDPSDAQDTELRHRHISDPHRAYRIVPEPRSVIGVWWQ